MSRWTRRAWVEHGLTAAGIVLLALLVRRVGWVALRDNLVHFGWWLAVTCGLAAAWLLLQAAAWWRVQSVCFGPARLTSLFRVKLISDAFNLVLPSASLGGDAMRAHLIRPAVPLRDGIPGVLFDKTVEFAASIIFLAAGLGLGLARLALPTAIVVPAAISVAVTGLAVVLVVVVLRNGVADSLLRWRGPLERWAPGRAAWLAAKAEPLQAMDANLRRLYATGWSHAAWPLGLHLCARFVGVIEFWLVMAVIGAPVGPVEALFIATIVTVGNTVFFFVPGQWGVMESVHVLVVQSLGYPPATGLSLSIIRRIRRLVMVGVGLGVYAVGAFINPAVSNSSTPRS